MKVGIITLWDSDDNYGQVLQAWALQSHLLRQGHEPYLIRYSGYLNGPRKRRGVLSRLRQPPKQLAVRSLLKVGRAAAMLSPQMRREEEGLRRSEGLISRNVGERRFDGFRARELKQSEVVYDSIEALRKDPPQADCYLTGSDQVWAPSMSDPDAAGMYLDFGPEGVLRVSYAASFGSYDPWRGSRAERERFAELLSGLDAVGVREEAGRDICRRVGRDARVTLDPTLLEQAGSYEDLLEDGRPAVRPPYLMAYFVNARTGRDVHADAIMAYADQGGLGVEAVYSSGGSPARELLHGATTLYPTVPGWLCMVRDAQGMVTSSFHGTAFAIAFHTPFLVMPLPGGGGQNGRLRTLLGSLGLMGRLYRGGDFAAQMDAPIDWPQVDERLDALRADSEAFLTEALAATKTKDGAPAHA